MHLGADEIAVQPEHFLIVQEELMRKITLALDKLLEIQNEARFELAVRASEHSRGRPPAPAW